MGIVAISAVAGTDYVWRLAARLYGGHVDATSAAAVVVMFIVAPALPPLTRLDAPPLAALGATLPAATAAATGTIASSRRRASAAPHRRHHRCRRRCCQLRRYHARRFSVLHHRCLPMTQPAATLSQPPLLHDWRPAAGTGD